MKYRILIDYGTEGYSLHNDEHETVNDAVVAAHLMNYGNRFLVIQIIDWEAKEKTI